MNETIHNVAHAITLVAILINLAVTIAGAMINLRTYRLLRQQLEYTSMLEEIIETGRIPIQDD